MMKHKATQLFMLIFLPVIAFGQLAEPDAIRVFYLGGQSNMDGYGTNSDLPDSLSSEFQNVWIFHGNPAPDEAEDGGLGIWEPLSAGHGTGFSSDGHTNHLTNRFGVELSFAKKLQAIYPGQKIAIIKYSRGGTSIDSTMARNFGCWEPDFQGKTGINQYDHFLKTIRLAMQTNDIDGNGQPDQLIPGGILWMQGESDSGNEEVASRYYANLKRLMDLIRAALRTDDLPVVLGKISDSWNNEQGKVWRYGELVQHAQEKFAATDGNASIVRSTRYYKYSDRWHYDSEGYIDLGIQFAEEMQQLLEEE
ncbi:MAG: sialate O-acetylesterase [Bacteroidota bacterium]